MYLPDFALDQFRQLHNRQAAGNRADPTVQERRGKRVPLQILSRARGCVVDATSEIFRPSARLSIRSLSRPCAQLASRLPAVFALESAVTGGTKASRRAVVSRFGSRNADIFSFVGTFAGICASVFCKIVRSSGVGADMWFRSQHQSFVLYSPQTS